MDKFLNNVGVSETLKLLNDKLISWFESAVTAIPNIVMAVFVMGIFIIIAKVVRSLLFKGLKRTRYNKAVINLLLTFTYITVILFGCFTSLEILNLEKTVTSILAGAGVIGLALGFAFQEIASNFVSGVFIAFRKPYQLGDIVEINDYQGEITKIQMRTTSLTTFDGLEVIIPNKTMFTETFINYTTTPKRRVDLEVGVSYGDDLDKVEKIAKEALESVDNRIKDKDIEIYYSTFDSSSINFTARVWIHYPGNQSFLVARHEMVKKIKKAFDQNNITIPFPIRTMDFGIKGGLTLDKTLEKMSFVDTSSKNGHANGEDLENNEDSQANTQ